MRFAILSDIHGNALALEAALTDLKTQAVDQIACLGDAIQGGPQPAQVVARLRDLACPVVMGNADAWLLTGQETGHEQISAERRLKMDAVREWSLSQLSADDQAFIAGFQPTLTLQSDSGDRLLCFHGSPASFDDVILPTTPEEDFQRLLGAHAAAYLTGGHTHLQQVRRLGDRFFFNPGSVGLAYNHQQPDEVFQADPWAEYAVLTLAAPGVSLEFRRVRFDPAQLRRVYEDSGRPYAAEAAAQYAGRP